MLLMNLLQLVEPFPELQALTLAQLMSFLSVCTRLRRTIDLFQPTTAPGSEAASAPQTLPLDIVTFLRNHIGATASTVTALWNVMKETVWVELTQEERNSEEGRLFEEYGNAQGISEYSH